MTTLKILQKLFARELVNELQFDEDTIEKMFPMIDEHVEFVSRFVLQLRTRQQDNKVSWIVVEVSESVNVDEFRWFIVLVISCNLIGVV